MNLTADHLEILAEGFSRLHAEFPDAIAEPADLSSLRAVLRETSERLRDNFPYPSPLYLGQMLKPPRAVAQLAYALAMSINPNNHAHDGGRASSAMERECVLQIAAMIGWTSPLGHLCGGGTIANLEALWVARETTQQSLVVASSQAHYTHARVCRLLNVPFRSVPVDAQGRLDLQALQQILDSEPVGTVVATLGTTGIGALDPVADLVMLRERYGFRLHVDAAYGGYFTLAQNLSPAARAACNALPQADSIVIDPHKHGLQPYGCGCVLFRDPAVARVYHHDSPYTYFTSSEQHLGEISLECSRSGAAATALWATMRLWPLVAGGEFARGLERCLAAAEAFSAWLDEQPGLQRIFNPELDIVVWLVSARTASECSRLSQRFFDIAASRGVHLALLKLPVSLLPADIGITDRDQPEVVCLRACLMKPEHFDALPDIQNQITAVCEDLRAETSARV